jgi:thiol-disulfide isomerase/thioredoxin
VAIVGLLLLTGASPASAFAAAASGGGAAARKATRLSYSGGAAESSGSAPLEEGRVRRLAEETAAGRPRLPNLRTALTARDCDRLVPGGQRPMALDRVVVVRYYAPWCRACKKAEPLFYQLARDHPGVDFVQVPIVSTNSQLVEQMGVAVIPWGQIYAPRVGLVGEAKINAKNFAEFRSAVAASLSAIP